MKQVTLCMVVALLAFMPAWGDDPPKEEKKEPTPKEQYQALVKEFAKKQNEIIVAANKAKDEERQELFQKYNGLGKEFAAKFYKLVEDNAKDPVATDALFWIVQNAAGSDEYKDASKKVTALIGDMPIKGLLARLNTMRGASPTIVATVVERAEKEGAEPPAGDLLAWAALNGPFTASGQKATKLLVEKFPDHKSIESLCVNLARGSAPQSMKLLEQILEKSDKPNVKAAAALGLGKCLAAKADSLGDKLDEADKVAAEAEKYFTRVIEEFGKDNAAKRKEAELELKMLQTLRVGKVVPEIEGTDLDGTAFKLSDYRGKVVFLDFWGNW